LPIDASRLTGTITVHRSVAGTRHSFLEQFA